MNRGGRPIDSVWQNYYKIERNGKHVQNVNFVVKFDQIVLKG